MGKTATIKERTVNVYVPDIKTLELWKEKAGNSSLSRFIVETVNSSIKKAKYTPSPKKIEQMQKEIVELKEVNKSLLLKQEELYAMIGRLHQEVKLCRSQNSLNGKNSIIAIDKQLISLLKKGPKRESEIIVGMGAQGNSALRTALIKQLYVLLDMELVAYDGVHWSWIPQD